jgi:hypothetical protein
MTAEINRRGFLASLIALGAAVALPAKATDAQIDAAWATLLNDPWWFVVNDSMTIVEPDGQEPKIRSDVYDISTWSIKTPDDLIDEIDQYDELRSHFFNLAVDELEEVRLKLDEHPCGVTREIRSGATWISTTGLPSPARSSAACSMQSFSPTFSVSMTSTTAVTMQP